MEQILTEVCKNFFLKAQLKINLAPFSLSLFLPEIRHIKRFWSSSDINLSCLKIILLKYLPLAFALSYYSKMMIAYIFDDLT